MQRRRQSAPHIFKENIAAEKAKLEEQASTRSERDALVRKIRQLDAAHLSDWLSSPGLQSPT